jgi:hypothetical protein
MNSGVTTVYFDDKWDSAYITTCSESLIRHLEHDLGVKPISENIDGRRYKLPKSTFSLK